MTRGIIMLTAALLLHVTVAEARARHDDTGNAKDSTATTVKEKKNPMFLTGMVADGFTKAAIPDVLVTLMQQDSTIVDSTRVYKSSGYTWGIGRTKENTGYYLSIERKPAHYILRFEHPNYETTYTDVTVKNTGKRRRMVECPSTYMKKVNNESHFEGGEIDEVVVKATKVKMVWKGDTLVYNADAFNVPEGSMLDALIKQLPGVELKDNGEIFVNGKKIQNLTLNGADFFKGNNKVMLENLPHFTVKNVEVYKKQTPENKYFGIDNEDAKEYTMDVVLKREYSIGGTANIEAGGGPSDGNDWRYKLKAFGLRFTDHTRAVLFGGMNNINESAEFEQESEEYRDRSDQSGDRHFKQVGGLFTYLGSEGKLNNSTEVKAEWKDDSGDQRTNNESFMNGSSTFSRSQNFIRSQPATVSLRNTLQMTAPIYIYSRSSLQYNRQTYEAEGWNITTGDAQFTDSINRQRSKGYSKHDYLTGRTDNEIGKRLATGDNIRLSLNGSFNRSYKAESASLNQYTYYKLGTEEKRDQRTLRPSYSYNYSARILYNYEVKQGLNISPNYQISNERRSNTNEEYLRDDNVSEVSYMLDALNTYETSMRTLSHQVGLNANYGFPIKEEAYFSLYGYLRLIHERSRMHYDMQETTRRYTYLDPYFNISYSNHKKGKRLSLTYYQYVRKPSVTELLSRTNTSDPMNLFLGNDQLDKSTTHRMYSSYETRRDSINQIIGIRLEGDITSNSIANGYTYDTTTGIRTYRPENIEEGNWSVSTRFTWNRSLGKKKQWSIGSELQLSYRKSADLATIAGSSNSEISRVGTVTLGYSPRINYQKGNLTLELKGNMQYRNMHRSLQISEALPTNVWDINYGFYAQYKLPWNFVIDTDMQMHSRRGYADSEMNDNRIYWDASLTKSFKAGRWVMKLRAYDLLGQVSNLRYYISASGRTEIWNNSLRRYALLTLSYRFTRTPKKK